MPNGYLERWLYQKLISSPGFHRFVRMIYNKVNGIDHMSQDPNYGNSFNASVFSSINKPVEYKPSLLHKLNAFRLLYIDEWRSIFGLQRKIHNHFK